MLSSVLLSKVVEGQCRPVVADLGFAHGSVLFLEIECISDCLL